MAMFFFLSGAGKRGAGDKATRAAAGLGWAGGDVFPWCRHGVYKLCTTNKTSLPPIHHRPNLSPSPTGFSFPHPAHLDAADPGTKYRQPRENSVRLCWPGPLGSREYISRSPFLPIGAHSPPFLQRCGGSFPASPTSRRCDAAPWAAAGTVDRCNGGAVSCQWILFPMAMTSSSCHRLQSCRCRQRGHSQTQLLFPRPLPVIIIITTRPYQASSSRCG